jgi:2-polyprenyl-3-methyl-5-hydroxy-6-metoxy-1,4-benzoquinol methylase
MKYDINYYEKMLREYSATAERICHIRWDWVMTVNPNTVLDYGCGCGWFRAWRPKGVQVDSYDIADYPQTGMKFKMYDVVCFWDVLEHIPDFSKVEPVLALARNSVVTVPIYHGEAMLDKWVHFKPTEHIHYFTDKTLVALFGKYGFDLVRHGDPECPPRKDVKTFLFSKLL